MSRSALWRREGNVKERQRQADETFRSVVEAGRNNRAKNLLPLWGPHDSFHLNPMLLQNIIQSQYFQKCCQDISDWNALVDEIYYKVDHLEPWSGGGSKTPSTAFCLLLRFLTLRATEKQMKLTLDHPDSPYIRAIGFLYLRYAGDPDSVWGWIEPYLYDEEPIKIQANSAKQQISSKTTLGDFVRSIFSSRDYYGTLLPRMPIQAERDLQVKLLQAEKINDRAMKHTKNSKTMSHFQKVGSKVMALYGDEENPVQWYDATVDRVITQDSETLAQLRHPKFVVTFPEYGNTETVLLGEMEMPGQITDIYEGTSSAKTGRAYDDRRLDRPKDRVDRRGYLSHSPRSDHNNERGDRRGYGRDDRQDRGSKWHRYDDRNSNSRDSSFGCDGDRSRGRSGDGYALPNEDDLYEEVRRRERATATANGRHAAARRPPTTKNSLMAPAARSRQSPSPERSPYCGRKSPTRSLKSEQAPPPSATAPPVKRSAEEIAAIQAKKRKLLAKYG